MDQDQQISQKIQLYLDLLKKWWWIPILGLIVGSTSGYFYSNRQDQVFQASTTLLVGQTIQSTQVNTQDFLTSERLARTYATIALQQPVLENVFDALQLAGNWQSLKQQVTVTPIRDTQLLQITAQAPSLEIARLIADEVANQLILLSPTGPQNTENSQNQQFIQERLTSLQAKIEAGQMRLQELETMMTGVIAFDQVQALQGEINTLEALLADWENNHIQLLIFTGSQQSPNYLAVTEPAYGNPIPIRPKVFNDTVVVAIMGLILSGGIIFLIEFFDDTLKSSQDLGIKLGISTLGSINQIKGDSTKSRLISLSNEFSPSLEAYRMMRSNIQFMSIDRPLKSILITSAIANEGKSLTSANLAVTMAQAGLRTILVDADLRRPTQHKTFHLSNRGGLTGLLQTPDSQLDLFLTNTTTTNLRVLPSGQIPPNPTELLASARMQAVMAQLASEADIVIYDSPPVLVVADGVVLANRVDGAILVIKAGHTRRAAIKQAIMNLQQASTNLLGGVINAVAKDRTNYYARGYYYQTEKETKFQPVQKSHKPNTPASSI